MNLPGKFITLEGIDCAGKSTYAIWLTNILRSKGIEVINTHEPGGTSLGERLRSLLLNEYMESETETLLFFAARCEHLRMLIKPALLRGIWVICERFSDSTYAYQGGGRKLSDYFIQQIEYFISSSYLEPDRTWLFDIPVEEMYQRLKNLKKADRFEYEGKDFFNRVRNAYLKRAKSNYKRIHILDLTQSSKIVKNLLKSSLLDLLN